MDYPFPSDVLLSVIDSIDTEINLRCIARKEFQWRNSVRPSSLKFATVKGQLWKLFNPDQLYSAGLIDFDEANKLKNANFMDVGGVFCCQIGTILHHMLLPAFEKALHEMGVSAKQEHPLISKKYCIEGQADLVIFDHEAKTIHLIDLKTTGPAILERNEIIADDYKRQLLAYGLCLEELYPDYKVVDCVIISLSKIPNSTILKPVETQEKWRQGEVRLLEVTKFPSPLLAQWEIDFDDLKRYTPNKKKTSETFLRFFEELAIMVVDTNKKIQSKIKGYSHWTIDDKLFEQKLVDMEKEYNA